MFTRVAISVPLKIVERPFHDDGQFVGRARLERGQSVLTHPNQRGPDGLTRATFWDQRDPDGTAWCVWLRQISVTSKTVSSAI